MASSSSRGPLQSEAWEKETDASSADREPPLNEALGKGKGDPSSGELREREEASEASEKARGDERHAC